MTLLEKFKLDHPNIRLTNEGIPCNVCPNHVGYTSEKTCLFHNSGFCDCKTCWNREYTGEDNPVKTVEESTDVAEKIKDTFVKLHETFDHGVSIAIVYRLIDRGYFDK